jgi:hypothetical protein
VARGASDRHGNLQVILGRVLTSGAGVSGVRVLRVLLG